MLNLFQHLSLGALCRSLPFFENGSYVLRYYGPSERVVSEIALCYYNVKTGICEGRMMFFAFVLDFDAPRAYKFVVRGVSLGLPNSPLPEG